MRQKDLYCRVDKTEKKHILNEASEVPWEKGTFQTLFSTLAISFFVHCLKKLFLLAQQIKSFAKQGQD